VSSPARHVDLRDSPSSKKGKKSAKDGATVTADDVKAATLVVSAEKKPKRKRKAVVEATAGAIPKIPKFPAFEQSKPDTEDAKTEDSKEAEVEAESESESSDEEEERVEPEKPKHPELAPKDGEAHADPEFDAAKLGLSAHATINDAKELLARGGAQYDALAEQLRLSVAANQAAKPTAQPLTIMADMNAFHITHERVNAEGFKRLRDKTEALDRVGQTLDHNSLITVDAQKLIGQILRSKKVAGFADWKA
jgi:hypothetical protein